MEAYKGGGGRDIAPLIFNLGARWTWVVNLAPQPGKNSCTLLVRGRVGVRSVLDVLEEIKMRRTPDRVAQLFPKIFLLASSFWLRKITTDPHILAYLNTKCPDDRYPEEKICIWGLILDRHEYMPVAYVIMHRLF